MKTIEEIGHYMSLFERYHPNYTPEELKQITVSLIARLPEREKKKFMNDYYEWADKKYAEELPTDYENIYKETNEAP